MKEREVSKELQILRVLRPRMNFSESEESYYQYKEKGYEGEVTFDKWAEPLKNMIFLNDTNFNVNNNHFQTDSLGISSGTLHIFEVKNFEGDYTIKEDKWYSPKGNGIKNPLLQLEKTETLINQLVKNMGWRINVEPHLVFVHPEFHLYDVSSDLPIVYPTQLDRFREKMLQRCGSNPTRSEIQFAEKLLALLIEELPYTSVPEYKYGGLRKGIVCPFCGGFYSSVQTTLVCGNCGGREKCTEAVLRCVKEIKLLFPQLKVTSNLIYDWCGVIRDIKTIRRILKRNFKLVGHGKSSYYI
ncbi:nuclease-related domain-containing protein [Bacillus sp. SG-1]|uniref:nuclease-related domain-containing protein n=1 Tax=Bacillus sp. SG-1 TaxID=161544 RepID=UPI001E60F7BB|nr:nuclease-related domain-containing protein [Bacillus sp. SG-1]